MNPSNIGKAQICNGKKIGETKLTPRFSKHKVKLNKNVTLITTNNKKLHKSKIKMKRKFQVDNSDLRSEAGNTGFNQQQKTSTNETGNSQDNNRT